MSDEEEDYMSESFLKSIEKKDVKPGLPHTKVSQRMLDQHRKRLELRSKHSEEEVRTKALEKPLDPSNKGFQMFEKMKMKQETSSADQSSCSSSSEQKRRANNEIAIVVKKNRFGLGHETEKAKREITMQDIKTSGFLQKEKKSINCRHFSYDVRVSQKACYNLDSSAGMHDPEQDFHWPLQVIQSLKSRTEEEKSGVSFEEMTEEQMQELTERLRQKYCYCIWCGMRFESSSDMSQNCPGNTRQSHDQ